MKPTLYNSLFEFEDDGSTDFDNLPYCECDESPTEDEEATNTCASCGKPLT